MAPGARELRVRGGRRGGEIGCSELAPRALHSGAASGRLRGLMQITTIAWLMQMRRRPRHVEDGVLGA
jgi:hypothetical protein